MDGKALRGTRTLDQRALMLISAFDHQITCVLLQQAVPAEANEQKAALDLLRRMVLTGRVVTADAGSLLSGNVSADRGLRRTRRPHREGQSTDAGGRDFQ